MKNNNFSKLIKKLIREAVSARPNCPIQIVNGDDPPKLKGRGYYFTNKRGDEIYHPNAYRRAWGKPIYNPSTIRVEVGSNWLLSNFTEKNIKMLKLKAFL
jgi:hypothetical protein